MSNNFKPGDYVQFLQDPKEEIFKVLAGPGDTIEIENQNDPHTYFETVPQRLLKKVPVKDDAPPGSIGLDGEGDLWVKGPGDLWEHLSVDGIVRKDLHRPSALVFDMSYSTIALQHEGLTVISSVPRQN